MDTALPTNLSRNACRLSVLVLAFSVPAGAQFTPAPKSPFAAGSLPASLAVADFNGDNHLDVAIVDQSGSAVTLLTGDGTGNLTPSATSITPPPNPSFIVAADFNKDGYQDLAIASTLNSTVSILLGKGNGTFAAPAGIPVPFSGPNSITVGDFNGDSIPDLAIANIDGKNVTILLGTGNGQFTTAPGSPYAAGNSPSSIAVADFNGDNIPDLAITNELDNTVTVLLGKGNGAFVAATGSPFVAGANPGFVVSGDFNSDGNNDLAIANFQGNTITVLLGNGAGGFTPAPSSPFSLGPPSAKMPVSIAVADFNGDYFPDLAIVDENTNNVSVLLGNGAGGFKPATNSPFAVGSVPRSAAIGDFNEDGKPDLAVVNNADATLTLLLNNFTTTPVLQSAASSSTAVAPYSIVSIYGTGLAPSLFVPPPSALGPTAVTITDASGAKSNPLELFYTSPTQINALMPQYIATGAATFSVINPLLPSLPQKGSVTIATVAPSLFTANSNGKGVANAEFIPNFLVSSATSYVFNCPGAPSPCIPVGLDVSSGAAALVLYGTGIRNRSSLSSVTVTINGQALSPFYAGEAPGFLGEDQVNVLLPASLAHSGIVYVTVSIGSVTSNQATLFFP
jgi:uncharacterized protein (TIGR03437 family)